MSLPSKRGCRAHARVLFIAALPLTLLALLLTLCLPASSTAAEPAPKGFFGVNATGNENGDFSRMAAANVGVTRNVFPFQVLKHGPDEPYDWSYPDPIVRSTAESGIDLIPMVYGAPPWVSSDLNHTVLKGKSKRAWRDLLIALVHRYGPGGSFWSENPDVPYRPIETWQIWNEPNSITWWGPRPRPSEYAKVLVRSAKAIHSVDPGARILTAGIVARPSNRHAIRGTKYLAELFKRPGVRAAADAVAYHPYAPSVNGVHEQLKDARKVLRQRRAGSTPIWITEIGWGTEGPRGHPLIKSVRGQNRAMRQTFELVVRDRKRLGLGRLLWFQWRDRTDDLCLWCESSGLLDVSSEPKQLLGTFRSIATR